MAKVITINPGFSVVLYPSEIWRMDAEREVLLDHTPYGTGAMVRYANDQQAPPATTASTVSKAESAGPKTEKKKGRR